MGMWNLFSVKGEQNIFEGADLNSLFKCICFPVTNTYSKKSSADLVFVF